MLESSRFDDRRFRMNRWYSPIFWFIQPVWSWLGWLLAFIIIIMIVGAISSITTSVAIEKKMVQAVLSTDQEEKKQGQ